MSAGPPFPESRYLNRELTWLDFNGRVLALAEDDTQPLLERVKFLAISSRNLDHFFQVRVAGLKTQLAAGVDARSIDGRGAAEQLAAIRAQVSLQVERQDSLLAKDLAPRLRDAGLPLRSWEELGDALRDELSARFEREIFPVLTPLSVDPAHPFPYISNLSLSLAVVVRDPGGSAHRFARVKVPPLFPRWLELPGGAGHLRLEELISAHIQALFPGMEIAACTPFRLTRDADLALDSTDAEDLLSAVESGLRRRLRLNAAVRLEVPSGMSERVRSLLLDELELGDEDVYVARTLLDPGSLWAIAAAERPELRRPAWTPVCARAFADGAEGPRDCFETIRSGDVLVHHPYESFGESFEAFLAGAAEDPSVLAIKHTLYRTSDADSSIIRTLIDAAAAGVQVVTLVELTARFDEQTNIKWARALEEAGVHVVYGVVGLKSHCKVTLVVRDEPEGIRRYVHVGTGNYNPVTALTYEDLGLFSVSEDLAADATQLFNHLTGCSRPDGYRKLWVAPGSLRSTLLAEIEREMRQPDGRVRLKVNGLADRELIDALYRASRAGVQVDLIVRGVCCLRPGVPGLSERIRVRSIVGPFLEHSRVYCFGSDERGPRVFMGSADLMSRNLDERVEVVVPVESPPLAARVREMLDLSLADDTLAWELTASGAWRRVARRRGISVQEELQRLAAERAVRTARDAVPPPL